MAFEFRPFLQQRGISFIEAGHNVARGHINIHCPFCGDDDRSEHLGINLETQMWACWRNASHAGRKPHRLIMALLRCSYGEAARIVGDESVQLSDFDAKVEAFRRGRQREEPEVKPIRFPPGLIPLAPETARARPAYAYLIRRGFGKDEIEDLCEAYDLRFGVFGDYRDRIVFPVREAGRGLVSYTGRAIYPARLRYRSPPSAPGVTPIKQTLWNHDGLSASKGGALFVVEGPFDALKLDWYGRPELRATALFGLAFSPEQLDLLRELAPNYRRIVLLMDDGATSTAARLRAELADLNVVFRRPLEGVEDPGAADKKIIDGLKKAFAE